MIEPLLSVEDSDSLDVNGTSVLLKDITYIEKEDNNNLKIIAYPRKRKDNSCCCCCTGDKACRRELLELRITATTANFNSSGIRLDERTKLFVIISPNSGRGEGCEVYENKVRPILEGSGCDCVVYVTKSVGDATRRLMRSDLDTEFDGLVVVGGDGMIYEVLQGLRRANVDLPIGVIPCGSGNGLAASLHHITGEAVDDLQGIAMGIARGKTQALDIWRVSFNEDEQHVYACLSLSWAFVADADIESEYYRCFGGLRFTIGAIARLCCLRRYQGRLYFSRDKNVLLPPVSEPLDETWEMIETEDFLLLWAMNTTHAGTDILAAPNAQLDNGLIELIIVKDCGRVPLAQGLLALDSGNHTTCNNWEILQVSAFRLESMHKDQPIPGRLVVDGELLPTPIHTIQVQPLPSQQHQRFYIY